MRMREESVAVILGINKRTWKMEVMKRQVDVNKEMGDTIKQCARKS